jgi:hypothetical protein
VFKGAAAMKPGERDGTAVSLGDVAQRHPAGQVLLWLDVVVIIVLVSSEGRRPRLFVDGLVPSKPHVGTGTSCGRPAERALGRTLGTFPNGRRVAARKECRESALPCLRSLWPPRASCLARRPEADDKSVAVVSRGLRGVQVAVCLVRVFGQFDQHLHDLRGLEPAGLLGHAKGWSSMLSIEVAAAGVTGQEWKRGGKRRRWMRVQFRSVAGRDGRGEDARVECIVLRATSTHVAQMVSLVGQRGSGVDCSSDRMPSAPREVETSGCDSPFQCELRTRRRIRREGVAR